MKQWLRQFLRSGEDFVQLSTCFADAASWISTTSHPHASSIILIPMSRKFFATITKDNLTCLACWRFALLRVILTSPDIVLPSSCFHFQAEMFHPHKITSFSEGFFKICNDTRKLMSTVLTAYSTHHVLTVPRHSRLHELHQSRI